jgi:choline dehydrogenase-like flavoprotein
VATITVVGSGASGVHFAISALQRGHHVRMLDVGKTGPPMVRPEDSFAELKENLDNPADYLLGTRYESVVFPDRSAEFYGFPPGKDYIFEPVPQYQIEAREFAPLSSFARGGLAQAWTGGSYPFNEAELAEFPFAYEDMAPFYAAVAARIGITGVDDDLADFIPMHADLERPLRLDPHSAQLLESYARRRDALRSQGCHLGHARLAVLSRDRDDRRACAYLGRCLWGCPIGALYTPQMTLEECQLHPNFEYIPHVYVSHFTSDGNRAINAVHFERLDGGEPESRPVESLVLAAGALASSRMFLESIYRATGRVERLAGLMDNRQILVPFVNLGRIGTASDPDVYQYNQVALGLEEAAPEEYIHCLITTLSTALIHPIVQGVPFDLKTSLRLFKNVHAALGLVNVNLHDRRREESYVTLNPDGPGGRPSVVVSYSTPDGESRRLRATMKRVKRALRTLGCIVPPGMAHVRPMGASVHYAGTLPMSEHEQPRTVAPDCRSHDFDNLYLVDGATFPFLPAKNITFTLMANATRVADTAF